MIIFYLGMTYGLICPVYLLLWVTDMWSLDPDSLWDLATTCPGWVTTIWAPLRGGRNICDHMDTQAAEGGSPVSAHSVPLCLYPPFSEIFTSHGVHLISSKLTPSISAVFLSPFDHLTYHGVCRAGDGCPLK